MLDEDPSNSIFDETSPQTNLTNVLTTPKTNYASKNRAKVLFGKQGRADSEFIW